MRVRHLNDFELQGFLDRRAAAPNASVSGDRYLMDLEAQEHLDNCPDCMAELVMYRRLFGELDQADEVSLPRGFASKVTFSLPPFRARRTKIRMQLAGLWAAGLLVSIIWVLGKLDWQGILGRVFVFGVVKLMSLKAWVLSLTEGWSLPEFDLARFWSPVTEFTSTLESALTTEGSAAGFIVLAACVLMLIASLDRLYLNGAVRRHDESQ